MYSTLKKCHNNGIQENHFGLYTSFNGMIWDKVFEWYGLSLVDFTMHTVGLELDNCNKSSTDTVILLSLINFFATKLRKINIWNF